MSALREFNPEQILENSFWRRVEIPSRGASLHRAIHDGLPYATYLKLAAVTGIDKGTLARVTAIAPATLRRRAKSGHFKSDESDRLYRFAEVFKSAEDLFEGDAHAARHWLSNPVKGLGDRAPVEMLSTSAESQAVLDLIGRLEQGVFN